MAGDAVDGEIAGMSFSEFAFMVLLASTKGTSHIDGVDSVFITAKIC